MKMLKPPKSGDYRRRNCRSKEKNKNNPLFILFFAHLFVPLHRPLSGDTDGRCDILKIKHKAKMTRLAKENPSSIIHRLLEYKKAMRKCIQTGADSNEMKRITKEYGFTLATPL